MTRDIARKSTKVRDVILWLSIACGAPCVGCRKCTAEPSHTAPGAAAAAERPATIEPAETIYDGGLSPGWQDWGWGAHDFTGGAAKINLTNYGGWILHHDALTAHYGALVFRMRAPASFGDFLELRLAYNKDDKAFPAVNVGAEHLRPQADGWVEVYVPWSALNPSSAPADQLMIHARTAVGTDWVLFDKIVLTKVDATAAKAALAAAPVRNAILAVDCRAPGHPISPYIYGLGGGGDWGDLGATASRWGGNQTTRYNWQLSTINTGKDWFFENQKSDDYRTFLENSRKWHAAAALTVPILGWVAKDTSSSGFPVSVFGPQRASDGYRQAGDGVRNDGTPIQPGPPTQTSVQASPSMIRQWIEAIRQQDGKTGSRSVRMYFLDNEPNLWNSTHRDIHPEALTYDELLDRTLRYGGEIRAADPEAVIAGPSEWGWTGYLYSAKDSEAGVHLRPDRRAHDDVPLIPWYLRKLREHETKTGVKILNVLDVHFYPQGQGVYGQAADPESAARRLRSTRALWDPTYKDESWIDDTVRLVPRLKEWIRDNYPGLAISIGEYNFGGEQHISGALALAEALGRFGTEGVSYAFYWTMPPKGSPAYWAFRAYRNFDGKGGHFLEESVPTRMEPDVSLFASRDPSRKHLIAVTVNQDPLRAARAKIELTGCGRVASRRLYTYGPGSDAISDDGVKSGGELEELLPPYSINVLDVVLE